MAPNWLRHNKFFELTPLIGFSFINAAKTILEVCVWYGILATFATITILNTHKEVSYYLGYPTRTSMLIESNTSNLTIPDIRMELKTSLFEYSREISINRDSKSMESLICNMAKKESLSKLFKYESDNVIAMAASEKLSVETITSRLEQTSSRMKRSENSSWESHYSDIRKKVSETLDGFFKVYRETVQQFSKSPMLQYIKGETTVEIVSQIFDEIDKRITSWKPNLLFQSLLLLEEYNSQQPITNTSADEDQFNKVLDMEKLVEQISLLIQGSIAIELDDGSAVSGSGRAKFQNWTSDKFVGTQTFVFDITDVTSNVLTTTVYSLQLMRYLLLTQSFVKHFVELEALLLTDDCFDCLWSQKKADDLHHFTAELNNGCILSCETGFVGSGDEVSDANYYLRFIDIFRFLKLGSIGEIVEEYKKHSEVKLHIAGNVVPLSPTMIHHLELRPVARFRSYTDFCYPMTHQKCLDECIAQAYADACQCNPWPLRHVKISAPLCDSQLCSPQHSCEDECSRNIKHACSSELYYIDRSSRQIEYSMWGYDEQWRTILVIDPQLPLLSIGFKLTDKSIHHSTFIEEYRMTLSSLISNIGALLEFWLGINVIGLIHIGIYSLVQCYQHKKSKTKSSESGSSDTKTNELNMIIETNKRLIKRIKNMRNNAVSGDTVRNQRHCRHRLDFLHHNEFYETTPLTGYSFINAAESVFEVYVWYGILILFGIITTWNIRQAVIYYMSSPTSTTVQISQTITQLDNITLNINMSLIEFDAENFIYTTTDDIGHMFCEIGQPKRVVDFIDMTKEVLAFRLGDVFDVSLYKILKSIKQVTSVTSKNFKWAQWDHDLNEPLYQQLNEFWTIYRNSKPQQPLLYRKSKKEEWDQLNLRSFGDAWSWSAVPEALVFIDSARKNQAEATGMLDVDLMKSGKLLKALNQLNTTIGQLYSSIASMVDEYIFVQGSDEISIHLRNMVTDFDEQSAQLSYELILPKHTDDLRLEIFSSKFSRMLVFLKSMVVHLAERMLRVESLSIDEESMLYELYCDIFEKDGLGQFPPSHIKDVLAQHPRERAWDGVKEPSNDGALVPSIALLYKNAYGETVSHYRSSSSIELITGNLMQNIEPFKEHHVDYIPMGRFMTKLETCYGESFDYCTETCMYKQHIELCGCHSWSLHYLDQSADVKNVCDIPCTAALDETLNCQKQCHEKQQFPCDSTLYRSEHGSIALEHFALAADSNGSRTIPVINPQLPFASVYLRVKATHHPVLVEKYEMAFSNLLAKLGGLLEFWLGINMISVIHLLVFIMKQCIRRKDMKTKGKKMDFASACAQHEQLIKLFMKVEMQFRKPKV